MNSVQLRFESDLIQEACEEAYLDSLHAESVEEQKEEILYWATHLSQAHKNSRIAIKNLNDHLQKLSALI